jgi:hypothetical protein
MLSIKLLPCIIKSLKSETNISDCSSFVADYPMQ